MFSLWHQVAASDDFETGSQPDNDSFGNSKSQDPASSESSDSALNHFGPAYDSACVSVKYVKDSDDETGSSWLCVFIVLYCRLYTYIYIFVYLYSAVT